MANFANSMYPNSFYISHTIVANADNVDQSIFTCPAGSIFVFLGASENHTVAGTNGSDVTLQLRRQQGTEAPASGDALLNTAFNMKGTAETPQNADIVASLSTRTFYPGDRLGLDFTGTVTDLAGVNVTAYFYRIR